MHRAYDERRRHIVQRLNAIDGLTCVMPKGAFYVMVDMSALIGKHLGDRQIGGSMDFADDPRHSLLRGGLLPHLLRDLDGADRQGR